MGDFYSQGYVDTMIKLAVSPEMAQRALTNATNRMIKQHGAEAVGTLGSDAQKEVMRLFGKYLRTNARSQGATRAQMPEVLDELRNQFSMMRRLGAI